MEIKYFCENHEKFTELVNMGPKEEWLKTRDLGGRQHKYMPIEHQQALANNIFLKCDVIDEKYQVIMNEIVCTVKLQVLPSYPHAEDRFITGSASKPIQQKSRTPINEVSIHKIPNSLEYNIPAVRASAISNALETFGNIFGRNVARKVAKNYKI